MSLLYDWLCAAVAERGGVGTTGGAPALVYRDTYLSWRGLAHRVDRRAQDLKSLGIGAGSWVGVMLGNVPELVVLMLAISKLRAVLVPLDPTTSSRDLDMILDAAPLRALITRPHGGDGGGGSPALIGSARPDARITQSRLSPEARRRIQGTLLNCHLFRQDAAPREGSDPAMVLFTLDAGGDPKGVVRTNAELEAIAQSLTSTLQVEASDQTLCIAPLHHSFGVDFGLLPFLSRGSSLFLDDETVLPRLAKLLREPGIDFFPTCPASFGALARVPTARPLRRNRGARFISSGSPLPVAVAEAFQERYGIRVLSCYHTTETGPVAVDRDGKNPLTVGTPFQGTELRVAAANGSDLPTGTTGPVWVKSKGASGVFVPSIDPRVQMGGVPVGRANDDGWLRTGDLGFFDRAGRLTLTGREDDLVKVDGRRVALGEVEGCLEAFTKVRAAEARVVTDELGGPRVVARVVRAGTCRAEELIDHCARNLAPHKVPRMIEFCDQLG